MAGGGNSSGGSDLPAPPPTTSRPKRRRTLDYDSRRGSGRRPQRASHTDPYGYDKARGGSARPEMTLVLCVFDASNSRWRTTSVSFNKYRSTDEELWASIRGAYRSELWQPWRRVLLFKRLKFITPIDFTTNGVPRRQDPKNVPGEHQFMHSYHHPHQIRSDHEWIDWFVQFGHDPSKTYGLEFVERLWAEKLAVIALACTVAIIIVSAIWCAKGGNLQTVFTVMSFVLTAIAALIALITLYYQVTLPG